MQGDGTDLAIAPLSAPVDHRDIAAAVKCAASPARLASKSGHRGISATAEPEAAASGGAVNEAKAFSMPNGPQEERAKCIASAVGCSAPAALQQEHRVIAPTVPASAQRCNGFRHRIRNQRLGNRRV